MRKTGPGALFFALFVAYAYFHQGGGWNQNSRFSQVRAVVEDGTWSINGFCAYQRREGPGFLLRRVPLPSPMPAGTPLPPLTGLDIAFYDGFLYPNKPPGTTVLALPAYALAHGAGRILGADPESWRTLTIELYLTTAFSIGLVGALGGVLFLAVSRRLHPDAAPRAHLAAALALGLGTIYFPFATMLFDHVPAAVAILAGFGLTTAARRAASRRDRAWSLAGAGLALGLGVVINYAVLLAVVLCGLYSAAWLRRRSADLVFFVLGGALPAVFLAGYHAFSFGSPWTLANTYQYGLFAGSSHLFLGLFSWPDWGVVGELLGGSKRGLLSSSPILAMAIYGFYLAFARRRGRLEAALAVGIFAAYLLMNASFNAWHGGNSFGPRYLLPALPVIALFLVPAFGRWPRATGALAVASALLVLAATAANPQIPADVEHPMIDRVLPSFVGPSPVSQNALGMYEELEFMVFGPDSMPAHWNSFNLGELVFPESLASLLPLLVFLAVAAVWMLRKRQNLRR